MVFLVHLCFWCVDCFGPASSQHTPRVSWHSSDRKASPSHSDVHTICDHLRATRQAPGEEAHSLTMSRMRSRSALACHRGEAGKFALGLCSFISKSWAVRRPSPRFERNRAPVPLCMESLPETGPSPTGCVRNDFLSHRIVHRSPCTVVDHGGVHPTIQPPPHQHS